MIKNAQEIPHLFITMWFSFLLVILATKLSQSVFHIDISLLKRTFKNLRDRFTKMHKEYKQSGSVDGIPMEPGWPYFKYLHFLVPFMKRRHGNAQTEYGDSNKYSFISFVNTPKTSDVMVVHENNMQTQLPPHVPTSALNQTIVPAKKSKLGKKQQGEMMSEVLPETEMETNGKSTKHVEADADDLFGQCIGKQLKKFNEYQKSLAKLKIQQVLHEVLLETVPHTPS